MNKSFDARLSDLKQHVYKLCLSGVCLLYSEKIGEKQIEGENRGEKTQGNQVDSSGCCPDNSPKVL